MIDTMKEQHHTSILKTSAIILLGGLMLAGCSNKSDTHQQAKVAPKTEKSVKASNNKTDAKLDNKQSNVSTPAKVSGSAYTGKPDPNKKGYRTEHLTEAEASSEKKAMSEIQKNHDAHGRKQVTSKDDKSAVK